MTSTPPANRAVNALRWLIATGGGSGMAPVAPATFGSAAAIIVYILLPIGPDSIALMGMVAVGFPLAVWAAHRSITPASHDPKYVVCDEVVAMWVTVLFVPKTWPFMLAAFFLFRLFDIVKPFPIRRLERLPGGLGVVADDVLAGVYANVVLQVAVLAFR